MRKVDYTGRKFNNIEVIKEIGYIYQGDRKRGLWLCKCGCGNFFELPSNEIAKEKRKSCGCSKNGNGGRARGKRKVCKYEIFDDYVKGIDSNNSEFVCDLDDYEKIKPYCWSVSSNGGVFTSMNSKTVGLHRFVMNLTDSNYVVDHINHDRTDNRKQNLRIVTQRDNMKNRSISKNNRTGRTGVRYVEKLKKYRVEIRIDGKKINGGLFSDFESAVKKREELEIKYWGKYRNKNL